jgi:hypothetical protein
VTLVRPAATVGGPAHSNERGAAAVELALVLFPLLLLVLGIAEFGRVYTQQLTMQHATREAARVIALEYDDPGMTPPILTAKAQQTLVDLIPAFGSVADVTGLPIYQMQLCAVGGSPGQRAVIRLQDIQPLNIPVLSGSSFGTVPINARAEMPCEG